MAININNEINAIAAAFEGRQVRQSIVDAFTAIQSKLNSSVLAGSGRTTITVSTPTQCVTSAINLPFTPSANTQIVATLRMNATPQPSKLTVELRFTSGSIYACLNSADGGNVPTGTYYVDWFVTDKGE